MLKRKHCLNVAPPSPYAVFTIFTWGKILPNAEYV
jgi:hypothetical protein